MNIMFKKLCSIALSVTLMAPASPGIPAQGPLSVEFQTNLTVVPQKSKARKVDYVGDVAFALDELEKQCGHFFKQKGIKWKKVRSEFKKSAKKIKTDQEHFVLMMRLLARVRDGHAAVELTNSNQGFKYPEDLFPETKSPGMFLTQVDKKFFVRNVFGDAQELGLKPGMEVLKINGIKVGEWVEEREAELTEFRSFSTDHQTRFYTLNWGMAHESGTRLKLEMKNEKGKSFKRTVTCSGKNYPPNGPVLYPGMVETTKDLRFLKTEEGFGYVHVRRCKGNLPEQMDEALAHLGDVKGLLLDFRGNSGGGFDHVDFLGRFVPSEKTFQGRSKKFDSTGSMPYGGPIVVIVDATVRSAGETAAGQFKEEGRGYMIGESPTAGMSASKDRIVLPSGLFQLKVAVFSNKKWFQNDRGIEGIGVEPHEYVPTDPEQLLEGLDSQIERGWELLRDFPAKEVSYKPSRYGWEAPE